MSQDTIVCVDDDRDITEFLSQVFGDDFLVLQASSAKEAFDIIQENFDKIAVIICDDRMPGMDGVVFFDALSEIFQTA